ncbi:MAG: transcriptional regulator NanR [Alphaproteobacteria bacterium]|uniref:transcriptional regulator NanR n=1 Tax=Rhizobium/Agrobacterium group TaxID=227290 RepID=UPI000714F063|nr:transcriptional regulator NanR [Rhizobium sp. Leaf321]KQQ78014.1 GntR family transcriptional regulator [Rhizobium sp. Leaf321]RYG97074.1 MAG: transcriptional regulator NanR [Alphaproteobacteria bacterium]
MNQPEEQIVRRKLSDEVFDRLERMITLGELNPGDEMPSERVLMERFGVGRPAIREAMQSLANMGLVSISHGERAKVLQLTARSIFRQVDLTAKIMLQRSSDSLEYLKSTRIFFERGMAREAAARIGPQDINDLRDIIQHQRRSLGNAEEFIAADMQFHTRIAQITGNPIFVAVSEAMLAWLKTYYTDMLIWTGKEKFTLVEHEEILDRLAAKDVDGADAAVLKHLERSRALYTR